MLILNHPIINPLKIRVVDSIRGIKETLPSNFLVLRGDLELASFCCQNGVDYASVVESPKEALFLVNLGVKFLICKDLEIAKGLQKLAENYLFDAKVLLCIKEDEEIEKIAKFGIDGVIFWEV